MFLGQSIQSCPQSRKAMIWRVLNIRNSVTKAKCPQSTMSVTEIERYICHNCIVCHSSLQFFSLCCCVYWDVAQEFSLHSDEIFLSGGIEGTACEWSCTRSEAIMETSSLTGLGTGLTSIHMKMLSWMKNKLQDSKSTNLPALKR